MYLVITSLWLTTADPCVEHVTIQSNCEIAREKQGEVFQNYLTIPFTWSVPQSSITTDFSSIFKSVLFHKYLINEPKKQL